MSTLTFDLRQSLRSLTKTPTFTVLAVLMLALGIGANTAIFSVVHHFLLARLPYPEADRMVQAYVKQDTGEEGDSFSPANFLDLERQSRSFEALAGYGRTLVTLTGTGEPERVPAASVSPDVFDVLGVRPVRGRSFGDELGQGEAILSHGYWQRRFDGDPSLLERSLTFDGKDYRVVGILPAGFEPVGLSQSDVWLRETHGVPDPPFEDPDGGVRESRGMSYFKVLGRLAPGVSFEQAGEEVHAVGLRLAETHPDHNRDETFTLHPFREVAVQEIRPALLTLLVAVVLVLFIACVNVAGLMLTRAAARQRELAVCAALGASRGRLLARMGLEGLVLGVAGGLLGLALGWLALRFLLPFAPEALFRLGEIELSAPVLAFTFAVSLVSVVVFALIPAWRSSRPELQETLKEGAGRSTDGAGHRRLRSGLVVGQIALALLMLVGAGLLLRSFLEVTSQEPGFDPEGVLTGSVVLPQARYPDPAQQARFFQEAVDRLETLPKVDSVAAVLTIPFGSSSVSLSFHREGQPPEPGRSPVAGVNVLTADYFDTLGIPLLGGRTFQPSDHLDAPPVAVVNVEMARQFFDGENPLGQRLTFHDPGDEDLEWVTVVGLVGDVRHEGLENPVRPEIYLPYSQNPWRFATFLIRAESGDPMNLAPRVREAILTVDPLQPVDSFTTLAETVHGSLAERRFLLLLIGVFAGLALLLATLGLYGIVSHLVTQRTREIGVRMALGADRTRMLLSVVGRGLTLAGLGVALGLAAALALVRGLESLLYGVRPFDPLAFAAVCFVLLAAASAAAFVPARRAASVDPAVALKGE